MCMDSIQVDELYRKYGKELYLYLYGLCRQRELAEDILQDTLCKALFSLSDSHQNVRAWLYMVGRNLMLNELKKRKREILSPENTVLPEPPAAADDWSLPENTAIRKESMESLYKTLLSLDMRKRELLLLYYVDGFTLKEAASIMGISHENARVLCSRAKKELRKRLEVEHYEVS